MKKVLLFVATFVIATFTQVVAQNSFSYQAVIRDNGEVISSKEIALRISLMQGSETYYQETQKTTTNAYGNININVGEGTVISGSMDLVPWQTMQVMMKLEVDAAGGSDFVELGKVQIRPAPYAMYAEKTSTTIQSTDTNSTEPIFAVKNSKGELLFAVYEDGVKVYVDMDETGSKAAKSKFAVAGRSSSKAEDVDLFTIDANGTKVYVDETNDSKAAKSKFAVAGRSSSKETSELLTIDNSGSTFYVDDTTTSKAAKSKFAVAGRSSSKAKATQMLTIDGEGTIVYVDEIDSNSKAAKSKFAVAGRSSSKSETATVLSIDANNSIFYVDTEEPTTSKAAKSKFAVAGRSSSKSTADDMFTIDYVGTTVYIDETTTSKAAKSKFAVAGRSSSKEDNNYLVVNTDSTRFYINDDADNASGFAVVGKSSSNALLSMNKDSVNFKTSMYVTGEVQTASGSVTRMADNSKPSKFLGIGMISADTISLNYTYYNSVNGEVITFTKEDVSGASESEFVGLFILKDGKIYEPENYDNIESEGINLVHRYSYTNSGLFYLSEGTMRELKYDAQPYMDNSVGYFAPDNNDMPIVATVANTISQYNSVIDTAGVVRSKMNESLKNIVNKVFQNINKSQVTFDRIDIECNEVMAGEDVPEPQNPDENPQGSTNPYASMVYDMEEMLSNVE